jgi:hypothetical protein
MTLLFVRLFMFALGASWVWLGCFGIRVLQRHLVAGTGSGRWTARYWVVWAMWGAVIVAGAAIALCGVLAHD